MFDEFTVIYKCQNCSSLVEVNVPVTEGVVAEQVYDEFKNKLHWHNCVIRKRIIVGLCKIVAIMYPE
jgi:hypothetical protein